MPTTPPARPHEARRVAESFGADPERYDQTRPRYPEQLINRIASGVRGRAALDVGIGTGVSARPFRDAGFEVLGVEVDARMAAFARADGFDVEIARFEDWDSAGRTFDLLIAGMTWHWIEPSAGARRAAEVLRPGGRLALFWNIAKLPAELAEAMTDVYRRVIPDLPYTPAPADPLAGYQPILAATADAIHATNAFDRPRRHEIGGEHRYTSDEWLAQVPTFGGLSRLPPSQLAELLDGLGATIQTGGGTVPVSYTALAITADRH
jgi:SAM-dependent methyltransferase